jgi:hypothetical protein
MIMTLTGNYLSQVLKELPAIQATTELVFKSTDTLEGIEKATLDKTAEMILAVLDPEIKEKFEMPEQPETAGGITVDNAFEVARQLVKTEVDRIKEKISQDIEAVKANPDLIANIPKETAWNIVTAFLFVKNPETRFMAAITAVEISTEPPLSIPRVTLLNSALVQHKSIAEARDSLEAEKKPGQQAVNVGGQTLLNNVPALRRIEIQIISTGITLAFPEYQDMITKLAGVVISTAPPRITTPYFTPLIISGGLFALFVLLPRFFEQKQQ